MNKVKRLYEQFHPENYELEINPDKQKMFFSGKLKLSGKKVGRPSQRITLHCKQLKINTVKLWKADKDNLEPIEVSRIGLHSKYDELRIHSQSLLYQGNYLVEISFSGKITKPMNGLYPSFYTNEDGQEEIILATQFESHHAREVFPCVDEPEAKAEFVLSLSSAIDDVVLSNSEIEMQKKLNNRLYTKFKKTPKMSTYLLAFIIGKVSYLESKTKLGVKVRTYASPKQVEYTKFALEVAVKTLDFYNAYFGINYPLTKCDLIALPDFASGAMENWGLITFREQALLIYPDNTSLAMKQYVANVIAHELTHQWFGNLVTMKWWNDLWLNESFASLMSYLAVDEIFPDWKVWTQFISEEQSPAMRLDSLENTHPINVGINHPDEIRTIFDNISYEKGASVLYMLMNYLGIDNFKKGLSLYLKTNSYSNTESIDLWKSWESVSTEKIAKFMDTWTKQAGFPLVKVKVFNDNKVELSQEKFYLNPLSDKTSTLWPLPLFSSGLDLGIFDKIKQTIERIERNKPLIVNEGHKAFYRVIYDPKHLATLAKDIKTKKLSALDRQGLLADSFEAARAGYQSSVDSFKLLTSYEHEDSLIVWEVIANNLTSVRSVMDDEELRLSMNKAIQKLVIDQYQRLGWIEQNDDSHFDKLLRPIILGLACVSDLPDAIDHAKKEFKTRLDKAINPDTRGVIYTTVARLGGVNEFEQLLHMHNQSTNSEERITIAAALTNFKQQDLINRSLALVTTNDVRLQDLSYWISYSFSNRYAKNATWEWLVNNWEWLKTNLGTDLSFYMMPRYVARAYSDESFIPIFKAFFEKNISESFVRPVNQAIESITWQAEWKKRDLSMLKKYFKIS